MMTFRYMHKKRRQPIKDNRGIPRARQAACSPVFHKRYSRKYETYLDQGSMPGHFQAHDGIARRVHTERRQVRLHEHRDPTIESSQRAIIADQV